MARALKRTAWAQRAAMVLQRTSDLWTALRVGGPAGILGAVLLDAYRLGVAFLGRGTLPEDHYRYIASALLRDAAYALPGAAWLGLAMELANGIVWGTGFAWAALQSRQVLRRPIVFGAIFGSLVLIAMRFVAVADGIAKPVSADFAFFEFVAYTLFFGVPIAFVVRNRLGTS